MSTATKATAPKKISKKEARHQIAELLEKALAGLKDSMGEKKFSNSIKKASKLFVVSETQKAKKTTVKKVIPTKKAAIPAKTAKKQ